MFSIVTASLAVSPQLELVRSFFELEGLPFDLRCDQRYVMTASKGRSHPAFGFVVVAKDGDTSKVLLDIYDVVHYVEEQGLKRC